MFDIDDESTDKMYNSVQTKAKEQIIMAEELTLVQLDTCELHDTIEREDAKHRRRSRDSRSRKRTSHLAE